MRVERANPPDGNGGGGGGGIEPSRTGGGGLGGGGGSLGGGGGGGGGAGASSIGSGFVQQGQTRGSDSSFRGQGGQVRLTWQAAVVGRRTPPGAPPTKPPTVGTGQIAATGSPLPKITSLALLLLTTGAACLECARHRPLRRRI